MAITSVGYGGTVTEVGWTNLAAQFGSDYSVVGADDFRVSAATSPARSVAIAPGAAYGNGVHDYSDSTVTLTASTLDGGSRWDTVVIRRNWQGQGGTTSLVLIPGTTSRTVAATRQRQPGTVADQPIALVQFTSSSSTPVAIIDLRVWSGNGGLVGSSPEVRQYLDRPGTVININGTQWVREFNSAGAPTWTEMGAQYITTATANNRFMTPAQAGARFVEQEHVTTLTAGTNWSGNSRLYKTGDLMYLRGRSSRTGSAITNYGTYSRVFTIPSAYRPTSSHIVAGMRMRGNTMHVYPVTLQTNGRVEIHRAPDRAIDTGARIYFEATWRI